ncbi:CHD9 protein, partial [Polypterus senegalus]
MDLFDDPILYTRGMEALSDDSFVLSGSSLLVDDLNLNAEFEPLQVEPLDHVKQTGNVSTSQPILGFEQHVSPFESLKETHPLDHAFSIGVENGSVLTPPCSQHAPSPSHQSSQSNGLFPGASNSSPMWGHHHENGTEFHQHSGVSHSMQQHNKSFTEHQNFGLFQTASLQQSHHPTHPMPPTPVSQENINQSKLFMDVNSTSSMTNVHRTGTMSSHLGSHHSATSHQLCNLASNLQLPYQRPSSTLSLPSCSVNQNSHFQNSPSSYTYSGNTCVNNEKVLSTGSFSNTVQAPVSDFLEESDSFLLLAGARQGPAEQHQQVTQNPVCENSFHAKNTQGGFARTRNPTEELSCFQTALRRSSEQFGSSQPTSDPAPNSGFSELEENLLQQMDTPSMPFGDLDPDDLLEGSLLPQFETTFGHENPCASMESHPCDNAWPDVNDSAPCFKQQVCFTRLNRENFYMAVLQRQD